MTPTQRKKHLAAMKELCTKHGFKEDNYGNWLFPGVKDFRIKFKKVNVRCEIKQLGGWKSANYSEVISKLSLEKFEMMLKHKKNICKGRCPVAEEKPKTEGVPLFKDHMQDPTVQKKVSDLIDKRNHEDYRAWMLLKQLLEDGEIPLESHEEARMIVEDRISLNDELMKTVAGN